MLQIPLVNEPRTARTATGANVTVTHKTVPIEITLRTPWGAVKVPPITFAVMPGSDFVSKELRNLRLTRALKDKLASECGISL